MKTSKAPYHRHRFPGLVISCAARWYFRFQLSLRDIEELLLKRGVVVNYETIRRWGDKVAAKRFLQKLLTQYPDGPRKIATDQLCIDGTSPSCVRAMPSFAYKLVLFKLTRQNLQLSGPLFDVGLTLYGTMEIVLTDS